MRWSEHRLAMLQEMGLRVWPIPEPSGAGAGTPEATAIQGQALAKEPPPGAPAAAPAEAVVRTVRPVGVAAMDWTTLRETVAGCSACKLCEGRKQTVFGVGHERAHWMIVGEAPGEQEDQQGEPFVGKSGQLLDNMLRAVGLTRSEAEAQQQVFIANTVKCRPPGNRNPEPAELAQCEPFLMRQIALVQPRIILAMGRFAVQSLLRSTEPIGRLRGRMHRYQGVPLVVTYHPAYLLRNPEDKARAWEDLCLALEVLRAPS
ncbi:MAG TPA: uracil-DNA glycosylase [Rhizobacter sp.]|nr:uracil-DNA glycosylase [Rhizobacter sp.]